MPAWSERELEDALWEDSQLLWPQGGFCWVGRQLSLLEGPIDLLGMLETEGGRRFAITELKASVKALSHQGLDR